MAKRKAEPLKWLASNYQVQIKRGKPDTQSHSPIWTAFETWEEARNHIRDRELANLESLQKEVRRTLATLKRIDAMTAPEAPNGDTH